MFPFRAKRVPKQFLLITLLALGLSACGSGNTTGDALNSALDSIKPPRPAPVCTVDRFQQPTAPISKKVDVLFVMDNSNSMKRHWQLMANSIGKLIHAFPNKQDIRFGVVLGTITKFPGVLFSDPSVPKVLDGKKLTEAQIVANLNKTFAFAMQYQNIDWKGAGEALFYSLYYAATTGAPAIQKQGLFRADAALSVIFMSDDAEEGFPYPDKQVWGLPPKCNWGHHDTMRKTFYDPNRINTDSTFAALKRLKGDMPLLTSAFVNITKQDIMVDNDMNAHCIYDSPGFGYFDIVKRTNGLLYSIHQDRGKGLELSGRMLRKRVELLHDFKLSKPADQVDPTTIAAKVDGTKKPHTYSADTNVVHLDDAGGAGSLIEINHCAPIPLPVWTISGVSGTPAQTSATISWQTTEYPTDGKVLYGTSPDSLNTSVADVKNDYSHALNITGLSPNTLYYFQVVANDEFGTVKKSEVASFRTQPDWTMSPLVGQASRFNATLTWNTPEYPTTGGIVWGTNPNDLANHSGKTAVGIGHTVTISDLQPSVVYYFQAYSQDEFGLVKYGNVISLTTSDDWAIVGFTGQALRNTASLDWQTPGEQTTSVLRYGTSADGLSLSATDGLTGTAHGVSLVGLAPGTTYYFQAVATGADGRAKASSVISLRTLNDWVIDGLSLNSTQSTITVAFNTTGYPTDGKVLWGTRADQLDHSADADANATEHTAGISGLSADTLYYVQAVAKDNLGVVKASNVTAVRTKPAPLPTWTIAGLDGSTDTVSATIVWNTTDYPTTGKVLWGTSPDSLTHQVPEAGAAITHSVNVPGLDPDTFYYFQVVATDDRGQTKASSVLGLRTQALPLPSWDISDVAASPTQTTAAITWNTSAYDTIGLVKWGTSASNLGQTSGAEAQAGKAHAITLTSLTPDTTYYFQVVSSDDRGQTKSSAVTTVHTNPIPLPVWSITDLATGTTQTTAQVSWKTPAYATKGQVKWGLSAASLDQSTAVDATANTHALTVSGLTADTTYYVQVVATDDRGQTQTSDVIAVRTLPLPLPVWAIENFAGTSTQTSVTLTFATSGYATIGYVNWGTSNRALDQSTPADGAAVTGHSFTVTGLTPDTTYYFQAVASDDRGQTKQSAVIAVKTAAVPLPSWSITGFAGTASQNAVALSFNTNEYATTGKILWGTSAANLNQSTAAETSAATAHAFTVNGLAAGTTYYFQAVATDDRGQTKSSAVISVSTPAAPAWTVTGFDGTTTTSQASLIWQTGSVSTKAVIKIGLSATDLTFRTIDVPSFAASHLETVTGLSPATTYFFQVVATDVNGTSNASVVISKTTKASTK